MKKLLFGCLTALISCSGAYAQCIQSPHSQDMVRVLGAGAQDAMNVTDHSYDGLAKSRLLVLTNTTKNTQSSYTYYGNDTTIQIDAGYTYEIQNQKTCPNGSASKLSMGAPFTIPLVLFPDVSKITITSPSKQRLAISSNIPTGKYLMAQLFYNGKWYTTLRIAQTPYENYPLTSGNYTIKFWYQDKMGIVSAATAPIPATVK